LPCWSPQFPAVLAVLRDEEAGAAAGCMSAVEAVA